MVKERKNAFLSPNRQRSINYKGFTHIPYMKESVQSLVERCYKTAHSRQGIRYDDITALFEIPAQYTHILTEAAGRLTVDTQGRRVDVEQLNNIKKNACSEDCSFCGQSAFFDTNIETYQLPSAGQILKGAKRAKEQGASSYCLVAAWREPPRGDFDKVCDIVQRIRREIGISVECSLGFLTKRQAKSLKKAGVKRYNHNLEVAPSKFPEICTTHTFQDRVDTLHTARAAGLELCTGGIIGLGESRQQRMELAWEITKLNPEEVTINILVPVPGTPLELQTPLPKHEIAQMFAIMRLLLPDSIIKISGGREHATDDSGEALLFGGANGIITNGYLTMPGNSPDNDTNMIRRAGLEA